MSQIGNVIVIGERPVVSSLTRDEKKILYYGVKRLFDVFISVIACIFLIPIMGIVKVINLLSKDTASIFYKQKRIGKDGEIFYIYKFRSMVPNADKLLEQTLKMDKIAEMEWKDKQKLTNDPRITKAGKILRKTSLDEFPQFINVLKGDMSMIGPRPLVDGELDAHDGNHNLYESVKPGITGWWACNGRSATSYKERLDLEYFYVNNCGVLLDIKCIFKTITEVLFERGAK